MPSRRRYSRSVKKFLVFMKKHDTSVVKLLMSLVLLSLIAPLDITITTWKHIFGNKTLILYSIC